MIPNVSIALLQNHVMSLAAAVLIIKAENHPVKLPNECIFDMTKRI